MLEKLTNIIREHTGDNSIVIKEASIHQFTFQKEILCVSYQEVV